MIEITDIRKSFDGTRVLDGVSHVFADGVTAAISGPSGKGKTTLINIMLGLMKPDSGTVKLADGARMACVFQEDRLIEHMTARQNLMLTSAPDSNIGGALRAMGLDPENTERVAKYSDGMRRRVAIARAVLAKPDILILDEPFKGLDENTRRSAAEYILKSCPNACRILVTHDPDEMQLMHVTDILKI